MSIATKFDELIKKREKIVGDVDFDNDPVILDMIALMTNDIKQTIHFLDTDCTEDEFIWLSEIFDEIAEKTKSKEFIEALRRVATKYPEAVKKYNIKYFIDTASEYVE